ncbi:MAG: M48 family metallopeptidase [Dehalococcoidia bacterium]|nr:M48 family metallopeptidase [Dehalococcoidia bacterium]
MARETRHQATTVEKRETSINGQTITYTVKRSLRARYVRLEVRRQTGLTVVVPRSYKIGQLPGLLESKERWISSNLARCGNFQSPYAEKELGSGDTVPYIGRDLKLVKRENHSEVDSVALEGNTLAVSPILFRNGTLELALEHWYRAEAARLIGERAHKLSAQMSVSYKSITIRGQKTRWGSCSHKKNLSFNWKLLMAPEPVIDYVVIHELAHLEEMNHSKRFWELVAQHCHRWRECKEWLKQHEANLTAKLCP